MPKKRKPLEETAKEILEVNKEHRDISKESLNVMKTSSKQNLRLQGALLTIGILTLIVTIFIWQGIVEIKFFFQSERVQDYAIDVKVEPSQIILNKDEDIYFTFTLENIGLKNITNFRVNEIVFYREIDNLQNTFYSQDYRYNFYCTEPNGFRSFDNVFTPREKCTLENVKFFSCKKCFDDKDKPIQLLFYFNSIPPIPNKAVNLTII